MKRFPPVRTVRLTRHARTRRRRERRKSIEICRTRCRPRTQRLSMPSCWSDFPRARRKAVFLFLHVTSQMSAIGTKRTWTVAPQMSAFGSKADIGALGLLGWRRKRARVTCSSFEPPTVSARQKNGLGAAAIATGWGCLSGRGRQAWRPFLCASLSAGRKVLSPTTATFGCAVGTKCQYLVAEKQDGFSGGP